MNQKGFATLEVILMIVVIGILAAVAVPRFTDTIVKANTAKIQADLSTLDNAIAIYYMENGKYPGKMEDLSAYVKDIGDLKPPTGKAYAKNSSNTIEEISISDTDKYELTEQDGEKRATLDKKTAGAFSAPKKTPST